MQAFEKTRGCRSCFFEAQVQPINETNFFERQLAAYFGSQIVPALILLPQRIAFLVSCRVQLQLNGVVLSVLYLTLKEQQTMACSTNVEAAAPLMLRQSSTLMPIWLMILQVLNQQVKLSYSLTE